MTLIYFPGSPGHHNDLEHILPVDSWSTFESLESLEKAGQVANKPPYEGIWLGYSFGCHTLLSELLKTEKPPKSVLLVSPYWNVKPQPLKGLILSIPFLGYTIVNLKRESILSEMSKKIAFPLEVPNLLKKSFDSHSTETLLAAALKTSWADVLDKQKIGERLSHIPTRILFGAGDKTSVFAEQIEPLLPAANHTIIENGGHGIMWTHIKEVRKWIENSSKKESQ